MSYQSTKILELGSCAFRQWRADSHCKYIHGYRLIAKFWFSCDTLDDKNWVVDFGGLKELKKTLEYQFDHTLCIANDDPLLQSFRELHRLGAVDLRIMTGGVGIEKTAEWCFNTANKYIKEATNGRCWVEKVEVWEHDKNSAIYSGEQPKTCTTYKTETAPLHTVVAAPAPEIQAAVNAPKPAPVGNHTSTGLNNPFGGTSWGL